MHLRRERSILQAVTMHPPDSAIPQHLLKKLEVSAEKQLHFSKIITRDFNYYSIALYLKLASVDSKNQFYKNLASSLLSLFNDSEALLILEHKLTKSFKNNLKSLFKQIKKDFFESINMKFFQAVYREIIFKLLTSTNFSKIEEKFIEPFLIEIIIKKINLENVIECEQIKIAAKNLQKSKEENEPPKIEKENEFLKYCVLKSLKISLPHERTLYSYLLRHMNPRLLLPFQKKGTQIVITSEMIANPQKLNSQNIHYWAQLDIEEGVYLKIKKAASFENSIGDRKTILLLTALKEKITVDLLKNLNIFDKEFEEVADPPTEENLQILEAQSETCLFTLEKKDCQDISLEMIDTANALDCPLIEKDGRAKKILINSLEMHFILIIKCKRENLRAKELEKIAKFIARCVAKQADNKFTRKVIDVVLKYLKMIAANEEIQLLYTLIEIANKEWEANQEFMLNQEFGKLDIHVVSIIGEIVANYGFDDFNKHHLKMQKLEFFYILGLSYKLTEYLESKKKLSRTTIDINPIFFQNAVFKFIEARRNAHTSLQNYLSALYGDHNPDYNALLLVIDEVVTYRMQDLHILKKESYFSVFTHFLYQSEASVFTTIRLYFSKIRKAYMLQQLNLRYHDESREHSRKIIAQDVAYLIEGCAAANERIMEFSVESLKLYIAQVPEVGFFREVLTAFAECISLVHFQWTKEYESKAICLQGRSLCSGFLLPTTRKELEKRLAFLLNALYSVLLRAHYIDDEYLRVRIQYLMHRSNGIFPVFGWKFLSHLINSIRDQSTPRLTMASTTCSWFIDKEFFIETISKIKAEKVLSNVDLWPVHYDNCNENALKKLTLSIEMHIETEFIPMPNKQKSLNIDEVITEVRELCEETKKNDKLHTQQLIYEAISRIKLIYIDELNVGEILNKVMEVCKRALNTELLKHVLQKVVPYFYSVCEYSSEIITCIGELLHFIVFEINRECEMSVEDESSNNIFDINLKSKDFVYKKSHLKELIEFHRLLVQFLSQHFHVCIAKAFPLRTMLQVLSNFLSLHRDNLEILPLESICYCLRAQLELVNMLKYSLECGEADLEEWVIDEFYFKTITMGLFHFEKKKKFYEEELQGESGDKLRQNFAFFIQICDYLRNDDYHSLVKRKLPKKFEVKTLEDHEFMILRYTLLYLIAEQMDRCKAYAPQHLIDLVNPYSLTGKTNLISANQIRTLMRCLPNPCIFIYNLVTLLGNRIEQAEGIKKEIYTEVVTYKQYSFASFLLLVANNGYTKKLRYWQPPDLQLLLEYLGEKYVSNPALQKYACYMFSCSNPTQLVFYLPQLFQTLAQRPVHSPMRLLIGLARMSPCFAHQLIWTAQVESNSDPSNNKKILPGIENRIASIQKSAIILKTVVLAQFLKEEALFFKEVDSFYERVTAISGKMVPSMTAAEKKEIIRNEVAELIVPECAYLPINPEFKLISINKESGTPMQSAAKCPFLLTFYCTKYVGPDEDFRLRKLKNKIKISHTDETYCDFEEEEENPRLINEVLLASNPFTRFSASKRIIEENYSPFRKEDLSDEEKNIRSEREIISSRSFISERDVDEKEKFNLNNKNEIEKKINEKEIICEIESEESETENEEVEVEVSCIFKVFDDIRQDCLALQIIRLFKEIYERHNLDLKLFPYRTIANRTGLNHNIGGIIEVVPKAVSLDSLGKTNEESLYDFFISNFGPEHGVEFQEARENFIKSQAAYSVISYLLQIKDRHNGNILIEKEKGYLIHIDFGFILEISPGGNMKFERAQFKLTEEMIKIMGGEMESEAFQLYINLVVKGFLTARRYHAHILAVVGQMARSGLPCFLEKSMENLEARFVLDLNDNEAAEHMRNIISTAADHWTTNWYDRIQWMQQKIYH